MHFLICEKNALMMHFFEEVFFKVDSSSQRSSDIEKMIENIGVEQASELVDLIMHYQPMLRTSKKAHSNFPDSRGLEALEIMCFDLEDFQKMCILLDSIDKNNKRPYVSKEKKYLLGFIDYLSLKLINRYKKKPFNLPLDIFVTLQLEIPKSNAFPSYNYFHPCSLISPEDLEDLSEDGYRPMPWEKCKNLLANNLMQYIRSCVLNPPKNANELSILFFLARDDFFLSK